MDPKLLNCSKTLLVLMLKAKFETKVISACESNWSKIKFVKQSSFYKLVLSTLCLFFVCFKGKFGYFFYVQLILLQINLLHSKLDIDVFIHDCLETQICLHTSVLLHNIFTHDSSR